MAPRGCRGCSAVFRSHRVDPDSWIGRSQGDPGFPHETDPSCSQSPARSFPARLRCRYRAVGLGALTGPPMPIPPGSSSPVASAKRTSSRPARPRLPSSRSRFPRSSTHRGPRARPASATPRPRTRMRRVCSSPSSSATGTTRAPSGWTASTATRGPIAPRPPVYRRYRSVWAATPSSRRATTSSRASAR